MEGKFSSYDQQDLQNLINKNAAELDKSQQLKLLDYIKFLLEDKNHTGEELVKYAGKIPQEDLALVQKAIEDCNKIDKDEW